MRETMTRRGTCSPELLKRMLISKRAAAATIADPIKRRVAMIDIDMREDELRKAMRESTDKGSRFADGTERRSGPAGDDVTPAGPIGSRRDGLAGVQRRYTTAPPVRPSITRRTQRSEAGPGTINGYAAVFYAGTRDTEYVLWEYPGERGVERVLPGTFDRAIRERHDACALFNHDSNLLLGRVSSGTVRLSVDSYGLVYEADLADTSIARDLATHLDRGDVHSSSFQFRVTEEAWRTEKLPDGTTVEIREILDVTLYDVSPCTYAAYTGVTPVGLGDIPEPGNPRPYGDRSSGQRGRVPNVAARLREVERIEAESARKQREEDAVRARQHFSGKRADVLIRLSEVQRIERQGRDHVPTTSERDRMAARRLNSLGF